MYWWSLRQASTTASISASMGSITYRLAVLQEHSPEPLDTCIALNYYRFGLVLLKHRCLRYELLNPHEAVFLRKVPMKQHI